MSGGMVVRQGAAPQLKKFFRAQTKLTTRSWRSMCGPGLIATWTHPGELPETSNTDANLVRFPQRWTNTTGRNLRYVRARAVCGDHIAKDHPHDGCPIGQPGVLLQIYLWKNSNSTFEFGTANGVGRLFSPGFRSTGTLDRLQIPGHPPYFHRAEFGAEIFDGDATRVDNMSDYVGNDGPIIWPDQMLSIGLWGVGRPTYPGKDLVVELYMEPTELVISISTPPPTEIANDNFADAIMLTGASAGDLGSNVGYTKESGEPNHAGDAGGASAWWKWTAPEDSDAVTIDLTGSSFATLLGVYTGTAVGSLTEVASDAGSNPDGTSIVSFAATSGTTYYIAVDGASGDTGTILLQLSELLPPGNDNFADAFTLSGTSDSATGTNAGATKETGEPDHAGGPGGASIWWKWTAPATGDATVDLLGSTVPANGNDTLLGVYTGSAVDSLTEVASNEFGNGDGTSIVTFSATSGTIYYIAVDTWDGEPGDIVLNLTMA